MFFPFPGGLPWGDHGTGRESLGVGLVVGPGRLLHPVEGSECRYGTEHYYGL